jgi:hypothetical protein
MVSHAALFSRLSIFGKNPTSPASFQAEGGARQICIRSQQTVFTPHRLSGPVVHIQFNLYVELYMPRLIASVCGTREDIPIANGGSFLDLEDVVAGRPTGGWEGAVGTEC